MTIASARTPVERLLARGLVVPKDANTVVLPRQIGLHLRGGRVLASTRPMPPPLDGKKVSVAIADRAAAGAALDLVRLVDRALEQLGTEPPPVLRTGGIGVRDLRSLAGKIGAEEHTAAAVLEIAYAAGLVAAVEVGTSELWLPTSVVRRLAGAGPRASVGSAGHGLVRWAQGDRTDRQTRQWWCYGRCA